MTGGFYTEKKVSQYSTSGWMSDLPDLNEGRFWHGCGYFFNEDMERVGTKHSRVATKIFEGFGEAHFLAFNTG